MKSQAKITANPTTGEVFTLNTNEDGSPKLGKDGKRYGFIRIAQQEVDLSAAVAQVKTRSAIKSIAEDSYNAAKDFLTEGTTMPGKIVAKESLIKEQGYTEKRAGTTENAPVCKLGGKTIYRTTVYTEVDSEMDVLIQHDNAEEIKAFQAAQINASAINA